MAGKKLTRAIHIWTCTLAVTLAAACSSDSDELDTPDSGRLSAAVEVTPLVLDFDAVAVDQRQTRSVTFASMGSAPYTVEAVDVLGEAEFFAVDGASLVDQPIAPGASATIDVTYTPCPEAWDGDQLRLNFDFSLCPSTSAMATLELTSNTREGRERTSLLGAPAQPPLATLFCPAFGEDACGQQSPNLVACTALNFGAVDAGQPCDLLVEVRNSRQNQAATAPLVIEGATITVVDLTSNERRQGDAAGFTLLTLDRMPLTISPAAPLVVPIPPGRDEGSTRFWIRYSGSVPGIWRGATSAQEGLQLTDGTNQAILSANILALGTAGNIFVFPEWVTLGVVAVGGSESIDLSVRNDGSAPLEVNAIRFADGGVDLSWSTETALPISLEPLERFPLRVTYQPTAAEGRVDTLEIDSSDPDEPTKRIDVFAGPRPEAYTLPGDGVIVSTDATAQICNRGTAELVVSQLDIGPFDGMTTSVDDFSITSPTCASLPCPVDFRLCAPPGGGAVPACVCETIGIRYQNNDAFINDFAVLLISTNDPAFATTRLVLSGR